MKDYKPLTDKIKEFCEEVDVQTTILMNDMEENNMIDECDEYTEGYAKAEAAGDIASQILQMIEQFEDSGKL